MKNKKILFPLLASLSFVCACTSELEVNDIDLSKAEKITFTATDFKYPGATRTTLEDTEEAVRFTWAENDTVGIFPSEGAQVYFPMVSGAGTQTATFTGGGWALKPASTYAAYYPFISNYHLDQKALLVSYLGQCQESNGSTAHLGRYDYMGAVASAPSEGSVNFDFKHLGSLVRIDITMPYAGKLRSLTLVAPGKQFVTEGTIDLTAPEIRITPKTTATDLTVSLTDVSVDEENLTATVYFMMAPADFSGKTLTARVVDAAGVTYEQTFTGKNFEAGVAYRLSSTMQDETLANVYHVEQAGTLPELIGEENKFLISEMKVTGPLNGTDIRFIREMAGRDVTNKETAGVLTKLDLREAEIVEGGDYYYQGKTQYYSSNMAIGDYMFYRCNLVDVRLPENIKSIGEDVFSSCGSLKNISLPEGLLTIGSSAFSGCDGLTSISFPKGLTTIGSSAFQYCDGLHDIVLPVGLVTLDSKAFMECGGLTDVTLPDGLKTIGSSAFQECPELRNINIPEGLTTLDDDAFYKCSKLTHISLPASLETIGGSAFSMSGLKSVTFSEGLVTIGSSAFSSTDLTSVSLPNSLKTIGSCSFQYCELLATVSFPNGLITIESGAFMDCTGLTRVILSESLATLDGNAFSGCI